MLRAARPWQSVMDAGVRTLAEVYAAAALDNLPQDEQAEEAAGELEGLSHLTGEADPLHVLLIGVPMAASARMDLVRRIFHGRVGPVVEALLAVLCHRDRLVLLGPIASRFRALLDRRQGKIEVLLTTAVELDEGERQAIRQGLSEMLHGSPVLQTRVDPDVVGGAVVTVGGNVYDGTIATRLARLRQALLEKAQRATMAPEEPKVGT